jgi:hypothetical protein
VIVASAGAAKSTRMNGAACSPRSSASTRRSSPARQRGYRGSQQAEIPSAAAAPNIPKLYALTYFLPVSENGLLKPDQSSRVDSRTPGC